jgi:hypothetical protein
MGCHGASVFNTDMYWCGALSRHMLRMKELQGKWEAWYGVLFCTPSIYICSIHMSQTFWIEKPWMNSHGLWKCFDAIEIIGVRCHNQTTTPFSNPESYSCFRPTRMSRWVERCERWTPHDKDSLLTPKWPFGVYFFVTCEPSNERLEIQNSMLTDACPTIKIHLSKWLLTPKWPFGEYFCPRWRFSASNERLAIHNSICSQFFCHQKTTQTLNWHTIHTLITKATDQYEVLVDYNPIYSCSGKCRRREA